MKIKELLEVSNLSSGTIAGLTGMKTYAEQHVFINWLFEGLTSDDFPNGLIIHYGDNAMNACKNAYRAYSSWGAIGQ